MKIILRWALAALLAVALGPIAEAQNIFNKFEPATGVLKGSSSTYVTTAAVAADIKGLWTGTCDATTFLRGDGACAIASTSAASPTNSVQFNNAGAFGGSANFTWDSTDNALVLDSAGGGILMSSTAHDLNLLGGNGLVDTTASSFTLGSNGSSGVGGTVTLIAGNADTNGDGGAVSLNAGNGAGSLHSGGNISLSTGTPGSGGAGGSILFYTNGSPSARVSIYPDGGMTLGSPTGASKGLGTINMTGCFINNVACASGTVTSITAGTGLTGGTINTSGTIALSTPVSVANGGTGTASPGEIAGTGITLTGSFPTKTISLTTPVAVANGGTGTATPAIVAGTGIGVSGSFPNQTVSLSTPVSVANGGTGTASPGLVAGTGISVTGSWPNQTVTATGSSPIIARAHVVTDGSSSCTLSNATGIASTTWNGTSCTVTFTTSYFSITPICTATANTVAGGTQVTVKFPTTPSSSATAVAAQNVSGGAVVGATLDVICIQ